MIDLLIDRVGNVNVFNILTHGQTNSESHLQSVIDDDLILEYIKEVENLYKVSTSFQIQNIDDSRIKPDILKDLKILGETFYLQFFPKQISDKLKLTSEKFLHFNIDQGLSDIPWELLHDGNSFLADKFYIGKTVKGERNFLNDDITEKLKMLIVVDPTEDLEWAQREGEELFHTLKSKVSSSKLEIQFISGKQITKLKLLSLIRGQHIIHYSGHLYFSEDPLENGWLLSNDKVLKAREIKNSGFSTNLVFSNSCRSAKSTSKNKLSSGMMNYFAGSFLMSGIKCFIGTNWEILDNNKTLDFTIRFYLSLFEDKTVGESLYDAREYARRNYGAWDLTWAYYSLHGKPEYSLTQSKEKTNFKIINPSLIYQYYPTPIAESYKEFQKKETSKDSIQMQMQSVIECFKMLSQLIGIIVFCDHQHQSLGKFPKWDKGNIKLSEWWTMIFTFILDFKKLEISMTMDSLISVLSTNKEIIYKMIDWADKFYQNQIENEFLEGYLITFQYYYENLLTDFSEFKNVQLIYLSKNSNQHVFFYGDKVDFNIISEDNNEYIHNQIQKFKGNFVLFHRSKKKFLCLEELTYNPKADQNSKTQMIDSNIQFL